MLQYWFDGPPVDVQIKPHGNSKGSTPFFPHSSSQLEKGTVKLQLLVCQLKPSNLQLRKVVGNWKQQDYKSYHETSIRLKTTDELAYQG